MDEMKPVVITISLLYSLFFFSPASISAQEELEVPKQTIYPGSVLYLVKRVWEKTRLALSLTKDMKFSYQNKLVEKRLSELDYISDKKMIGEIEKGSQRFSYYAGILAEATDEKGSEDQIKQVIEKFSNFKKNLDKYRDRFPSGTAEWRFVQENIDTLSILSEKLKN